MTASIHHHAAANSALVQKVRGLQAADYALDEALNKVAQEVRGQFDGGDIFCALAHVSAAYKSALLQERPASVEEAAMAQLSFGM